MQRTRGFGGDAVCVVGGDVREKLRIETSGSPSVLDVLEIPCAHVGDVEFDDTFVLHVEQFVQGAQTFREEIAQPFRFREITRVCAVVADDRARDEPVGVRVVVSGQIFDDFGAETKFVERGVHMRLMGERACGCRLHEQGVVDGGVRVLCAECVDARFGRTTCVGDRVPARETAYARWRVGDSRDWCAVHGAAPRVRRAMVPA